MLDYQTISKLNSDAYHLYDAVARQIASRQADFEIPYLVPTANTLLRQAKAMLPNDAQIQSLPEFGNEPGNASASAICVMASLIRDTSNSIASKLEPTVCMSRSFC